MKFTKIPANACGLLQFNAGLVLDDFDPETGTIGNILGATKGGLRFSAHPVYLDLGEDIDNIPANTMQFRRLLGYDPAITGTFVTVTPALAALLAGPGTVSEDIHFVPAADITPAHFADIWLVGDYSGVNTDDPEDANAAAGFVAVHLKNVLNLKGFEWTTSKNGSGEFPFEFHGGYDADDFDALPWELYIRAGTDGGGKNYDDDDDSET